MMPDRYLDSKKRSPNPYSAVRAQRAAPAGAVVPVQPDEGQVQPDFAGAPAVDPASAPLPPMSPQLRGMPVIRPGQPGSEDVLTNKYGQETGRGKTQNDYQDPLSYETHQSTVMNSPLMKQMADALDQEKQLRADYLKTAPVQADLSPTMALADFLAKGKGTAQGGYVKPTSYEDRVAGIRGMLGDELKNRQNQAQLAFEQTGGLKSGAEEATTKATNGDERQQGYKIPHPFGMMMPFQQGQAIAGSYEKAASDANATIKNAIDTRKLLANPSWYTSNALKGAIVRGIGVNRITQNELFLLGGGSQDVLSQVDRAFQKATTGDGLLPSDRHAIEQYNELTLKGALQKREQIKQQMGQGYQGITVLPQDKVQGMMNGRDTPIPADAGQDNSEAARAQAFANQFMQMMRPK